MDQIQILTYMGQSAHFSENYFPSIKGPSIYCKPLISPEGATLCSVTEKGITKVLLIKTLTTARERTLMSQELQIFKLNQDARTHHTLTHLNEDVSLTINHNLSKSHGMLKCPFFCSVSVVFFDQ